MTVVPYAASAQQAPQLPPPQQVTPGRDQITIPTPTPPQSTPTATVQASNAVNAGPCPPEIVNSPLRATVRRINFSSLTPDPLDPKIVSLLSAVPTPEGEQPLSVICTLRDQAVERLRQAGYVAAVQIPPQELANGELTLNVVTAQLTQVRVIGDAGKLNSVIADRIEQLKAIKPFNEREAQRLLLLTGEVPGLTKVQLTLRASPTGTVGEVVGDLEVAYNPVVILANVQNFGSRALGRETGYVSASIFGLTGLADVTTVAASTTADFHEQRVGQVGHHFQIGGNGLTFGGSFTYAVSPPDLDQLKLRSRSLVGTLDLSMPLVRSINNTLRIGGGIDLIEQKTQALSSLGAIPLNLDKLRVAFLRLDGSTQRARLRTGGLLQEVFFLGGSIEARQGLNIFDATKRGQFQNSYSPSRTEGNPEATVIRGLVDARVRLGSAPLVLAATGVGQWSSGPLLNFEEYSIGNLTLGRGYDPGSNSADRVLGGRLELRAPIPAGRIEIEPFAFYDHIHIWNKDTASVDENDRSLRSYGGGARIKLPGLLYLEAMYAHPRDKALRANAGPPSDRFLLSLTARFAPKL